MVTSSVLRINNYRHVASPVREKALPQRVSHIHPIPGGINGVITIRWTAGSPVLVGGAGSTTINRTEPLRLYPGGDFCLSGAALKGMIKSAYRVATHSAFAPIQGTKKVPVLSGSHHHFGKAINDGLLRAQRKGLELNEIEALASAYRTIADVARKTILTDDAPFLDWTDALFGFVQDEDPTPTDGSRPTILRPGFPEDAPQTLASRIGFGFAKVIGTPHIWPDQERWLEVPGASPQLHYAPGYLENGDESLDPKSLWEHPDSYMKGLKVYPVHDPEVKAMVPYLKVDGHLPRRSKIQLRFLEAGTSFTGDVEIHNLHPDEFGVLLWCLTLGKAEYLNGDDADHAHNIGHLKGYGFGQIKPQIIATDLEINPTEEKPVRSHIYGDEAMEWLKEKHATFEDIGIMQKSFKTRSTFLDYKSISRGNEMLKNGRLLSLT